MLATPQGQIKFVDSAARRWLKRFFGRPPRAERLPRTLCRWLTGHKKERTPSFVAKHQKARLYLKKEKASTRQSTLLLLELVKGRTGEQARRHRELTPRERDVLSWVARGKSNGEIALILEIKPATVKKHLERIYQKLGVENRTAAAGFGSELF